MAFERTLNRLAYGKPKSKPMVGKLIDRSSSIGVRVFQITRLRPLAYGIRKGKGR